MSSAIIVICVRAAPFDEAQTRWFCGHLHNCGTLTYLFPTPNHMFDGLENMFLRSQPGSRWEGGPCSAQNIFERCTA